MGDLDAEYFSAWYADMGETTEVDRLWAGFLGLPAHVLSTSLLTGAGLEEVAGLLDLDSNDVLLDLACGRAGYGLELVARSGARLVGVDFAPAAIDQARANAARLGLADRSRFRVADMTATTLEGGSVTAVLCVDAAPFAPDPAAPAREAFRVLAPGGRVVLTGWEPGDRTDPEVPERLRSFHFDESLRSAGFVDVESSERPDWAADEHRLWQAVAALPESDDPAVRNRQEEARSVLARSSEARRILAHARRP